MKGSIKTETARMMLTVLVVVAHLAGFLGFGSVTVCVNGLFDNVYLLVVGRARSRGVNGGTGDGNRLLEDGAVAGEGDGVFVDVGAGGLAAGSEAGAVDGGADYGSFLAVVGLDAGTILALSNVNDRVVRAVLGIELDTRLGVACLRSGARRDG